MMPIQAKKYVYVDDYRNCAEIKCAKIIAPLFVSISKVDQDDDCIGRILDENRGDKQSQEIIRTICAEMTALARVPFQTTDRVGIDVGQGGKYQLVEVDGGLSIRKLNENNTHNELVYLSDYNLERFFKRFHTAKINQIVGSFELVDTEQEMVEPLDIGVLSNSNQANTSNEERLHDSTDGYELIGTSAVTQTPAYLLEGSKLGEESFGESIDIFLKQNKFDNPKKEDGTIAFNDFVLYPLMSNDDEVKKIVDDHKKDESLILMPYLLKRNFIRDHVVLLAVGRGVSTIVEPKFGSFYAIGPDKTIQLYWQYLTDDINCGFYVYHMITSAIMATRDGKFNPDLDAFFTCKEKDEPQPTQVRERMRRLYLASQEGAAKEVI